MLKKTIKFLMMFFLLCISYNVYSNVKNNSFIEKEYSSINDFVNVESKDFIKIKEKININDNPQLPNKKIYNYYYYMNLIINAYKKDSSIFNYIKNKFPNFENKLYYSKKEIKDSNKIELSIKKRNSNLIDKLLISKNDLENNNFVMSDSYFIIWNKNELFAVKDDSERDAIYINKTGIFKLTNNLTKIDKLKTTDEQKDKIKYTNIFSFFDDLLNNKNDAIKLNNNDILFKINENQLILSNYSIELPTKDVIGSYFIKEVVLFLDADKLFILNNDNILIAKKDPKYAILDISYTEMLNKIKNNEVISINYTTDSSNLKKHLTVVLTTQNGDKYKTVLLSRNDPIFTKLIEEHNIKTNNIEEFDEKTFNFWNIVLDIILQFIRIIFFFGMILILYAFLTGNFKNKIKKSAPKEIDISFDDIAGHEEAKKDIQEVLDITKNKKKYEDMNIKPIKGILLYGQPGNGKTMFAKAIAKECNAEFFSISGSEMIELYVGMGAKRVRDIFKEARKAKRSVIFIDEIDAIGQKRSGGTDGGDREYNQTINQLLTLMDGFDSHKYEILVVAATNQLEILDNALLRPGRFDRQIHIGKPSFIGRKEILKVYFDKHKETIELTNDDYEKIAGLTIDFSGADISNLVNEARIMTVKDGDNKTKLKHVIEARNKVLIGNPRADIKLMDEELKRIAYHEVGHTVMILNYSKNNIEQVSITPYGNALGITVQTPDKDNYNYTKTELENEIYSLLGGRGAEEVFLKDISSGASNDIERVYSLAFNLITRYGMNNNVFKNIGIDIKNYNILSEKTKYQIEQEIQRQVETIYLKVLDFFNHNKEVVEELVDELMKKHTLNKEEVLEIWKKYAK